jgi:O-antigen/teichoic acid export membrane protein
MTNYTKFAVKSAGVVFIISLVAAFLGYLVRFILARNLAVEEFGLFYAVFAFLTLLSLFKSLGFDKALIKFIPELIHRNKKDLIKSSIIYAAVIQFITNTLIIVLIYLLSKYLSLNFFHNPNADIILKLMAIAFFIDSFVLVLMFSFQGFQKMGIFASIDMIRMLIILAVILIGIKLNYGILSPVIAYIISPALLLVIFGWIFVGKIFPDFFASRFVFDKNLVKKISKYGIFIVAVTAANMILWTTDTIVLTYFSGLKEVALYNIALPTAKILLYFPLAVGYVLFPLTSELWAKRKKEILRAGIEALYKYSIIIVLPLAFIMLSFAALIINVLFGENYILASNLLKILSIGLIFATLQTISANFFLGIGKPKTYSKIIYNAALFNLVANLILIPILGAVGAALSTTLSYFIMMFLGLRKIRKYIIIELPIKIWIKTLAAGLIFIFVIWLLKKFIFLNVWLETVIVLALSGIVYIALLFLLRIININELKDLYKRIVK